LDRVLAALRQHLAAGRLHQVERGFARAQPKAIKPADGARPAAPAPAHRLACAAHEPSVLAVDGGRPQGIRARSIHNGAWAWALAWASVNIWRASSSGLSTWFGYHCCVTSNE
jgi:hypothetical protein